MRTIALLLVFAGTGIGCGSSPLDGSFDVSLDEFANEVVRADRRLRILLAADVRTLTQEAGGRGGSDRRANGPCGGPWYAGRVLWLGGQA